MTPVGFEPMPFRNGALSHRLRPLGQSVHARSEEETHTHHEDQVDNIGRWSVDSIGGPPRRYQVQLYTTAPALTIELTLAGLEPAIFGSEDQCLIH